MAMSLNQFIAQYNNQHVAFPGDNAGYQCVDLVQFWAQNFGYSRFTGNAVNIFSEAGSNYEQIANTPAGVPEPGDIVVWGENAEAETTASGHTGIFVSGNQVNLIVFNQNAPVGSPCHEETFRSYAGVLGWLRPKALVAGSPAPVGGSTYVVKTLRQCSVRSEPTTTAPLAGSEGLAPGVTFESQGQVAGQEVTENGVTTNLWEHSVKGNFVWSGNTVKE